jgi:hypothetical protein
MQEVVENDTVVAMVEHGHGSLTQWVMTAILADMVEAIPS